MMVLARVASWWSAQALPWLKRNWQWILLPVGLLMLLGRVLARPKITSTELQEADEVKRDALADKEEQLSVAAGQRSAEVQEAKEDRDSAVSGLVVDQETRAARPLEGEELTDFLKDVGRDTRR